MVKILSIFSLLFLFAFNADSCPTNQWPRIDSQLFSTKDKLTPILSKRFQL